MFIPSLSCSCSDDFDILQGDVQGLSDTWTFLKSLAKLDAIHDSEKGMEKKTMRERKAAGGLFNWEVAYSFFSNLLVALESILLRVKTKINGRRSSLMPCENQLAISKPKVLIGAIIFRNKPFCFCRMKSLLPEHLEG